MNSHALPGAKPRPTLSVIPEGAPFSTEQRQWLNGFLAGLHSHAALNAGNGPQGSAPAGNTSEPPAAPVGAPLLILYGSQSGNAEGLAHDLAARIRVKAGGPAVNPRVLGMEHFADVDFAAEKHILALSSTWGEGDMPDNAAGFWTWLQSDKAPSLGHASFAVLGLGDRNYRRFCQAGKNLDGRFAELGARRLRPLCECDTDFEGAASAWLGAVLDVLAAELPAGTGDIGAAAHARASAAGATPQRPEEGPRYDKKNPFPAALLENRPLNARASAKDTRHLAFSLVGSGLEYKAGDALDVLDDFSKAHPDPQAVIASLGRLNPRLYSIASSPKAHPGEVHLCVGIVRQHVGGRLRRGVASTHLAERVPLGTTVPVYIQPSAHFAVPEASGVPLIMVGPGTGIAPFRAFLEERRARGDAGRNWLLFGDQKRALDFLYAEELTGMERDGFLTRLDLAFSRDQEEKVYVQDRMLAQGRELFAWLEQGAHFCVCGDAKRMAKDVDAALHRIIAQEGGMSEDKARAYVEMLKKEKRYNRDVY